MIDILVLELENPANVINNTHEFIFLEKIYYMTKRKERSVHFKDRMTLHKLG
jgi:hypothetical protein